MSVALQKRLAILGAVLFTGLFVAANAHLIAVAFRSQTGCVAPAPDRMPAKRAC
ncbi:hypothetical protein [Hoeflea sp.]|jgi:hypothetical protein|uniref:hypothetical protein n=1 Tax=Hoeflea sp. TaxID=1940281 RepID=UPI00198F4530|nr:hypothetical protein [Hoeflea sp.]MBC7285400.1 hypothetical protein [Hoeflea sp.]